MHLKVCFTKLVYSWMENMLTRLHRNTYWEQSGELGFKMISLKPPDCIQELFYLILD